MDIAKLESFLTLAKIQNFAKASDQLYISQPALSKRIRSLETELGVPLFNRMGNQTFLTIQGEAFQKFADEIVASYYNAKKYIKQIENMEHGTLNFGATNFIGVYLMPKIIAEFYKKYPNIKINMVINTSQNILEMLHRNQLEFVFLSDYIIEEPDHYITHPFVEDHLKLIVGNEHPLFGLKSCSFKDVSNDLYITKKKQSSQYRFLQGLFNSYGFDFQKKLFISSQEAIKESVINNIGISILSERAVEREIKISLLHALELQEISIHREIQSVYIKNKLLTPAAKEFLHFCAPK